MILGLHPLIAERDSTPYLHMRDRHNALESKNSARFFLLLSA